MRWIWLVVFVLIVAVIATFAVINSDRVPIKYLDEHFAVQSVEVPMALLIAGVYVLGMFTGWTVVGFFKRTVQHIRERPAAPGTQRP